MKKSCLMMMSGLLIPCAMAITISQQRLKAYNQQHPVTQTQLETIRHDKLQHWLAQAPGLIASMPSPPDNYSLNIDTFKQQEQQFHVPKHFTQKTR